LERLEARRELCEATPISFGAPATSRTAAWVGGCANLIPEYRAGTSRSSRKEAGGLAGYPAFSSKGDSIATQARLIRITSWSCAKALEAILNRYVVLYLATLMVLIPLDFLFLGMVAKGFFAAEVGDMLGEIRLAPAILFYLVYVAGILVFVSGLMTASWQSTLLYGALFGFFCYATFELTSLSLLRHWTWPVVVLDVTWGSFVTALSSTAGLLIANWVTPRI
jgi:uncharacterized membrane protein